MFFPIGTDHHDGRIGIVSLSIIVICILVHVFVHPDTKRVETEIHALVFGLIEDEASFYESGEPSDRLARHFELVDSLAKEMPREEPQVYESEEDSIEAMLEKEREMFEAMRDPYAMMTMEKTPEQLVREKALKLQVQAIRETSILYKFGLVSSSITVRSIFSHMFLHGDWIHLLGNLWFFYIVGVMMERYWGPIKFLIAYLITGILSALGFIIISEMQGADIETVPLVGASGAIAGMMGGLFVTWNHIRVKIFYWVGLVRAGTFEMSIGWYLGIYFAGQLFWGLLWGKHSSVAYMAHVSGFFFGILFGKLLRGDEIPAHEIANEGIFDAEHLKPELTEEEQLQMRYSGTEAIAMASAGVMLDPAKEASAEKRKVKVFPSEEAWGAYKAGDYTRASAGLVSAMDVYLRDVVRFEKNINQDMERIYEIHKNLQIPVEAYYQWAMQFEMNNLKRSALFAYELCAQYSNDDVEFRLRALLKSAELRVETNTNINRAKQIFDLIIKNDQKGALRRQAEYALEQLG